MNLKKNLITKQRAQGVIEYVLLAAISIMALLGLDFIVNLKDSNLNGFSSHFKTVKSYITYLSYDTD